MNKYIFLFLFLISLTAITSCKEKIQVDTIVYNAVVYTVNDQFEKASAFTIKDGRFLKVGDQDSIMTNYKADEIIDAGGRNVYPGFNDGHSHFLGYGLYAVKVDLIGTESFDEVIARTIAHQKEFPADWIIGRGWDQNDWELKEFPNKEKLDEAFPNTPVVLRRVDGHALIANTEAIKRAGITTESWVEGGEIVRVNREPTGIFIDRAMKLITDSIPVPGQDEMVEALLTAQKDCFAVGLTSVTDAGVDKNEVLLMKNLQDSGELKMRIYAMLSPTIENFNYFFPKGPMQTGRLTVSAVKLYIDGALGSRGALLIEPYTDDPGNTGLQLQTFGYYDDICQKAYDAGFQVNTHAIGDSGNRIMLHTYAKYLKGKNDLRWRVEHAQVVNPEDMNYFGDYNIIASVQSTHCTSDMYWADERLGEERIKHAYAYQDLLDQNGWLVNGTDFPVEGISPLKTFYAAIARQDEEGWPEGGFQMENAISREDALRSITIWPAKGSFEEDFKGSIEAGKVADFVFLDEDIMDIELEDLLQVEIFATYIDGVKVFSNK